MLTGLRGCLFAGMSVFLLAGTAAADPAACKAVRFSDVGWIDITSTTALASTVLEGLGYQPSSTVLAIPVTYVSMKNANIDVYLGDWQPSMEADTRPYIEDGSVVRLRANLEGAKYTFAVPAYVAAAGVESFADLDRHADWFGHKIYGIEPGNNGNRMIQEMIEQDRFGLADWKLIESSEQGMLSQVDRAIRQKEWIVFLGWAPHPMNKHYHLAYLAGGDDYFGPDYGRATVYTDVRIGYTDQCPNVARLLEKLSFTLEIENEMMDMILNQGASPEDAARRYLSEHPELLTAWLDGVTTIGGQENGLAAVRRHLGME